METQGSFKIQKISGNFFLDLKWDLVNSLSMFVQKLILFISAYLESF